MIYTINIIYNLHGIVEIMYIYICVYDLGGR